MLPPSLHLRVPSGRQSPCQHGCVLTVERSGLVTIEGPGRDALFEQARRFLRLHARGLPALSIAALLVTPPRPGGGRDSWSIIVGADVAFSPTAIEPVIPREAVVTVLGAG